MLLQKFIRTEDGTIINDLIKIANACDYVYSYIFSSASRKNDNTHTVSATDKMKSKEGKTTNPNTRQ